MVLEKVTLIPTPSVKIANYEHNGISDSVESHVNL